MFPDLRRNFPFSMKLAGVESVKLLRLLLLAPFVCVISGCLVAPQIMIAADVVSAAMKAGVHYAEKNKPTTEERWEEARIDRLERRAQDGDIEAQYELGLIYQRAKSGRAKHWVCRAANNGLARAQAHMGHWYNEDRKREDIWPFIDIRPNNETAFVWYSLAESNGDLISFSYRERLEKNVMSAEELMVARARLDDWQPENCGWFTAVASTTPGPPTEGAAR